MQEIGNRLGTCRKASQVALVVKNLPVNAGDIRDVGSIPGLGRSPGEGHSYPLQYSCLENPMDRGTWRATVHRVAKSRTRLKWFSTFHKHNFHVPMFHKHWFKYFKSILLYLLETKTCFLFQLAWRNIFILWTFKENVKMEVTCIHYSI